MAVSKCVKGLFGVIMGLVMLMASLSPNFVYAKEEEQKVVRVGWYESSFNKTDRFGRRSGYAYDYQMQIANYTGWRYEYVEGTWQELFQMLIDGEIDMLSDVSFTEERAEKMLFSSYNMGEENYYAYVAKGNTEIRASDYSSFNGKKIGNIKNSVQVDFTLEWEKKYGIEAENIELTESVEEIHRLLQNGDIDVYINAGYDASEVDIVPVCQVGASEFFFAVNMNRPDLLQELDAAMEKIHTENRYFNQHLAEKYIGYYGTIVYMSADELNWLKEKKTIRVGYKEDYLPFCGTDSETGELIGALAEFLSYASRDITNVSVDFETIAYDSVEAALKALNSGEVDCVFPVNLGAYDAEERGVMVTDDLLTTGIYFVYKDRRTLTYSEEDDLSFVLSEGNINMETYVKDTFPNSKIFFVHNSRQCIEALANGFADCTLAVKYRLPIFSDLYEEYGMSNFEINSAMGLGFAVRKGEMELLTILSLAINTMPTTNINTALIQYSVIDKEPTIMDAVKSNILFFMITTLVIVTVILGLLVILSIVARKESATRRETERLLAIHENHTNIVSNAGLGIWAIRIQDGERTRMRANDKMLEILGITDKQMSEEEVYTFWYHRIQPEAKPTVEASVQEMVEGKFSENTFQWEHPDKGIIYTRYGGSAVKNEDGSYILSGYYGDVTAVVQKEQQQMEALEEARIQAEAANNAKTTFLFNMSHDIRTPMNAILGFARLLKKDSHDPEVVSDYLNKIEESGEYLLSVINNVLDMARIESGEMEVDYSLIDIAKDGKIALNTFELAFSRKNITFTHTQNIQNRYILGDVVKMNQVIMNLVSNAIKYTPEGGSISLDTTEIPCDREGYAKYVLTVADTGIGMSEEFQQRLFKPFTREKNTTESKVIGTGLGMSIVKKLADLIGATISVKSKIGEGTTISITFELPIAENVEDIVKREFDERKASEKLRNKRILLAEDNDLNAEIAMAILENNGMKVERAEDGIHCINMLHNSENGYYDIILMDIQMPRLNGYDTTSRIRELQNPYMSGIPIIAMTANAFEEDRQNAISSGMNGHIAKPIDVAKLLETMTEALNMA